MYINYPDISKYVLSEILNSLIFYYWGEREIHTNTDYDVNVWILCVITHISKYLIDDSDGNHMNQVRNVIKTLFCGISDDDINFTLHTFWSEYTYFNYKNCTFGCDGFIGRSKYIRGGNSHFWYHKYSLSYIKVLGFVACRVTSKILGISASEYFWGDVKTIKYGKISDIRSDVSDKKSIVYKSTCIESYRFGQTHSDWNLNECSTRHVWDDDNDMFDHQLEKWGLEKFIPYKPESVTGEFRTYI